MEASISDDLKVYTMAQVYDMTSFYPRHPGGTALLRKAGKDVTTSLQMVQAHGLPWNIIQKTLAENMIGIVKRY